MEDEQIDLPFIPDEKRKECIEIVKNLSNVDTGPTEESLRRAEADKFEELEEVLEDFITEERIRILKKLFKEVSIPGGGYHKRFMNTIDELIYKIEEDIRRSDEWVEYCLATSNDS